MPIEHEVKDGDCISSIAFQYGFFPDTVWNDPANAELKELRQNPNVLMPGDIVVIPDKTPRLEACTAAQPHKFKVKGVPETFVMRLLGPFGEPRKDLPYTLTAGAFVRDGTTDAEGKITERIPPEALDGILQLGEDKKEEIVVAFGHLNPIEELSGVQARLKNLGIDPGPIDGLDGPLTQGAVKKFQTQAGLDPTGQVDDDTRAKLKEAYGC